jgi:hypothetical protein
MNPAASPRGDLPADACVLTHLENIDMDDVGTVEVSCPISVPAPKFAASTSFIPLPLISAIAIPLGSTPESYVSMADNVFADAIADRHNNEINRNITFFILNPPVFISLVYTLKLYKYPGDLSISRSLKPYFQTRHMGGLDSVETVPQNRTVHVV